MDESNIKTVMDKGNYTFDMLFNDIQADSTDGIEIPESVYMSNREYKSKLIVVHMLLCLADLYKAENYNSNEKLRNAIETKVDGDEQLSGYLFFVSQNDFISFCMFLEYFSLFSTKLNIQRR